MRSAYSVMANDTYGEPHPRLKELHGLLKEGGIPEITIEVPSLANAAPTPRRNRTK